MTIGWVVTKSYSSGFTEFLIISDELIEWSNKPRSSTIFRDRVQAERVVTELRDARSIEISPVEVAI